MTYKIIIKSIYDVLTLPLKKQKSASLGLIGVGLGRAWVLGVSLAEEVEAVMLFCGVITTVGLGLQKGCLQVVRL